MTQVVSEWPEGILLENVLRGKIGQSFGYATPILTIKFLVQI